MSSDSSGLCSEFDLTAASLPQREILSVFGVPFSSIQMERALL